ncbi:MAG: hypothetical protein ACFFFG_05645 [Candidatus Thorarchaeota archaeon]
MNLSKRISAGLCLAIFFIQLLPMIQYIHDERHLGLQSVTLDSLKGDKSLSFTGNGIAAKSRIAGTSSPTETSAITSEKTKTLGIRRSLSKEIAPVIEHYVDQRSDVDASSDRGYHNIFSNLQDNDSSYNNMTEGYDFNTTLIGLESFEGAWIPTGWSGTGRWNKEADQAYHGVYSADFDATDTIQFGVLVSPAMNTSGSNAIYIEFWWRDEWFDDGELYLELWDGTAWNTYQDMNLLPHSEFQWVFYSQKITDASYYIPDFQIRWRANGFQNENAYIDYVNIKKEELGGLNLDLEVQFTDVVSFLDLEELAIRTGSFGGSEDINISYWTGSAWSSIAADLNPNSWNNFTVNLSSSTFTIKFGGSNTSGDSIQDWWEIDAVLLRIQDQNPIMGNDNGFVWLDSPDEVNLGSTVDSWVNNQDLSDDSVPSYATGVILGWVDDSGSNRHAVARGSEDKAHDYMQGGLIQNQLEADTWRMQVVKLGTHKYIDTWREHNRQRLYVMGYTVGADPRFRPESLDLGLLTANSNWNTLTVPGVDENTTGVILFAQLDSLSVSRITVRATGSTDGSFRYWEPFNSGVFFVKIDNNDQFEYFLDNTAHFYLIAEVGDSIDWLDTNRDDISGTSNGWTTRDLDSYVAVPSNATGAILQFESVGGDRRGIARKEGQSWQFPQYDVGGGTWLMGGSGMNPNHEIEVNAENTDSNVYIHALTLYGDFTPPQLVNFGVDESGTGQANFWADIVDFGSAIENATLLVNSSAYSMSFNGTYWTNSSVPIEYGGFYTYQIVNTSDIFGNNVTDPTVKTHTFLKDTNPPTVLVGTYDHTIGVNGTFNTTVMDVWGVIDKVLLNVTYFGGSAQTGVLAVMRNTSSGFINDTILMPNGLVKFRIIVNDTSNNVFTSTEFVSYRGFNAPPSVENITLTPNPIHSNESLTLSYDFSDSPEDSEGGTEIRWYKNLNLQPTFNDSYTIPASALIKNDQWYATIRPKDGQLFGPLATSLTVTIQNTAPQVINPTFEMGNPSVPGIIVEDEEIILTYAYSDIDNDLDASSVQWYVDGVLETQFNGLMIIPANRTKHSETWRAEIHPYDGSDYGKIVSVSVFVESRPVVNDAQFIPKNDTEGHYSFVFNITDSRNNIKQVEVLIYIGSLEERRIITSGSLNLWELDFQLQNLTYLNMVATVNITVVTEVVHILSYEISKSESFNLVIKDESPPRVVDAWYTTPDVQNPSNITFYADIVEEGSGIAEVILAYDFKPIQNGGGGASTFQQTASITMEFVGKSGAYDRYIITVLLNEYTSSLDVIFQISTRDNDGNFNTLAFTNLNLAEQRIPYVPPSLPTELFLVAGIAVILIFVGAIVYVRFFRKPELVGLDKGLVMQNTSNFSDTVVRNSLDSHSVGVVVSYFDQAHGPIPIIVIPEILKDNFSKLVELSDRSFSVTGFADTLDAEIYSSFDFVLVRGIRISILSFGYFLSRPEARGGQENITLNILIHQEVFPLLNQFKDEIQEKVHEAHLLMNDENQNKELIARKIVEVRELVTSITLSYQNLYGTIELLGGDTS